MKEIDSDRQIIFIVLDFQNVYLLDCFCFKITAIVHEDCREWANSFVVDEQRLFETVENNLRQFEAELI